MPPLDISLPSACDDFSTWIKIMSYEMRQTWLLRFRTVAWSSIHIADAALYSVALLTFASFTWHLYWMAQRLRSAHLCIACTNSRNQSTMQHWQVQIQFQAVEAFQRGPTIGRDSTWHDVVHFSALWNNTGMLKQQNHTKHAGCENRPWFSPFNTMHDVHLIVIMSISRSNTPHSHPAVIKIVLQVWESLLCCICHRLNNKKSRTPVAHLLSTSICIQQEVASSIEIPHTRAFRTDPTVYPRCRRILSGR